MPLRSTPHGPYSPTTGGTDCWARPIDCGAAIKIMTPATALAILPMPTFTMPTFFHCVATTPVEEFQSDQGTLPSDIPQPRGQQFAFNCDISTEPLRRNSSPLARSLP